MADGKYLNSIPVGLDLLFDGSIPVKHRILMAVSVSHSQGLPVSTATLFNLFEGTDSKATVRKALTRLAAEGKIHRDDGLNYWKPENQPPPSEKALKTVRGWLGGSKPDGGDWKAKNISLGIRGLPATNQARAAGRREASLTALSKYRLPEKHFEWLQNRGFFEKSPGLFRKVEMKMADPKESNLRDLADFLIQNAHEWSQTVPMEGIETLTAEEVIVLHLVDSVYRWNEDDYLTSIPRAWNHMLGSLSKWVRDGESREYNWHGILSALRDDPITTRPTVADRLGLITTA